LPTYGYELMRWIVLPVDFQVSSLILWASMLQLTCVSFRYRNIVISGSIMRTLSIGSSQPTISGPIPHFTGICASTVHLYNLQQTGRSLFGWYWCSNANFQILGPSSVPLFNCIPLVSLAVLAGLTETWDLLVSKPSPGQIQSSSCSSPSVEALCCVLILLTKASISLSTMLIVTCSSTWSYGRIDKCKFGLNTSASIVLTLPCPTTNLRNTSQFRAAVSTEQSNIVHAIKSCAGIILHHSSSTLPSSHLKQMPKSETTLTSFVCWRKMARESTFG
jgi:hypothetical protein